MWFFFYITDESDSRIKDLVIEADVLPRITELLNDTKDRYVASPAIRVHGSILAGSDEQVCSSKYLTFYTNSNIFPLLEEYYYRN